jgi:Leucine-rich repeat (LRR) protein
VGGIPELPDSVQMLDLSYNRLSGRIPTYLCRMALMESILLSSNSFSGVLPDCWQKDSPFQIIDFSRNKFHGEMPSTMVSITSLAVLSLRENGLSGNLPTSLKSCNRLIILDLSFNNLSGEISTWMGDSQQSLLVLLLRSNQFSGEIPEQLSQFHDLCFLDLAGNNLSGPVPLSLGSLTAMSVYQEGFKEYAVKFPQFKFTTVYDGPLPQVAVHIATGSLHSHGGLRYLFVISVIDLSGNQLTGEIPKEIGALSSLRGLNLSGNHISGIIPEEIGNLWSLEALDLSHNGLSGPIPLSIANLSFLSWLDLSYNDLSGRIPAERQFLTFSDRSFLGNANLCGLQVSRICLQHNKKHRHKIDKGTYLCAMLGFACGLSLVSAILLFSATARKAYFRFTDSKLEEFRTVVEIKLNRFKAGRCQSMEARRVCNQNSITCYELESGFTAPGH